MVYTITLDPLLDRIVEVEELIYDDVNTIVAERKYPGGKGIDVSRVIKELGGQSIAMGFAGGYNGLELVGRLVNEGIICDFTKIHSETRAHITINQRKKKLQTLLSTLCPPISQIEVDEFYRKIQEIPEKSYVVISGNPPQGMNDNFYAQLISTLKEQDTKVFLDTDGEALKQGAHASPFLIKPNIHEFNRLVDVNVSEVGKILEYAKPYQDRIEYIVVSLGARGVVGISKNGSYYVSPPKVNVRSSIGAGDSLVAGVVFAFSEGASFDHALKLGVACGTAAALNAGNDLCTMNDIEMIKKDVLIKKI
ncbi:MAG: 1-phosphofructokinase [Syntrophus sp. (in: bacteria)]|nr:1-phosphofructokinase [Syntrophus sp. (in: bacteria)]